MLEMEDREPCYVISVAAKLLGVHAQTLRYYERVGLVTPSRSKGKIRLYSANDIARVRQIKRMMEDFGVNLAGVDVILNLRERITQMDQEMEALRAEAERLRSLLDRQGGTGS